MPKLAKTSEQKQDLSLLAAMAKHMVELEYTTGHMTKWLDVCKETYYSRRKRPENFSIKDLRIICDKLKFTDREVCAILGVKYNGRTGEAES